MKEKNIFDIDGLGINGEYSEILHESPSGAYLERIISRGQTSPDGFWYDQDTNEHVTLLCGEARLDMAGEKVTLFAGDTLFIPAHVRHRIEYTSKDEPCIWLCWHYK